jgi:menaquinone-dependent protoporphyrinogen oxidase
VLTNASFLVVYASRHGHSRRVALAVAERLAASGIRVDTTDAEQAESRDTSAYSGVVLTAPIYRSKQSHPAVAWLARHREDLAARPLALLVVSLTAVAVDEAGRAEAQALADGLAKAAGVRATLAVPVAGALEYERYGFVTRLLMKRIAARKGLSTDTSRNHDYTDWAALDDVVRRLLALVDVPAAEARERVRPSVRDAAPAPH